LYLHVGCPKSGTTYLQRILEHNRDRLADAGVLVVGERHVDRVQAALQVREDPRWLNLPPARRDMWGVLVEQIRAWEGPSAVLSYELVSAATAEQAARALADLEGIDVHVVITARDFARSVPSAWQERLKFGVTSTLEEWSPPPADRAGSEWGWRTTDPLSVAERWGATLAPDHVHIVTMPRDGEGDLWQRFAEACGLGAIVVDTALPRVNESLGAVEAELLRRINSKLRPPLDSNREQARWLRDVLANTLLAARRGPGLGMTDEQYAEATERSDGSIAALTEAGYAVSGDLADLRATRQEGRLPGDVTDGELVDASGEVIVELLLLLREAENRPAPEPAPVEPPPVDNKVDAGRVAQRLARPWVRQRDQVLADRLSALETRVQENRALHQRVAALQDVVTQLLLPSELRDGAVTRAAIEQYREESL
jgi:hypothetical protein